jgi:hypothetical protein
MPVLPIFQMSQTMIDFRRNESCKATAKNLMRSGEYEESQQVI